jgi:hypothetical protein
MDHNITSVSATLAQNLNATSNTVNATLDCHTTFCDALRLDSDEKIVS